MITPSPRLLWIGLFATLVGWANVGVALDLTPEQQQQLDALYSARTHGLNPDRYALTELDALAQAGDSGAFAALLESSFVDYAQDLSAGQTDPRAVDPDWHIEPPMRTSVADVASIAPPHEAYRRLREASLRYLAVQRLGGWPSLGDAPELRVGMRHPQVRTARDRLRLSGDFDGDAGADVLFFGSSLDRAVRRFQSRHGLRVDGVIDDATRAALNVPVDEKIRQLAVAMERWRWLPRDLGDAYVWVNVSRLEVDVVEHGATTLTVRAIVGHSSRPTPTLSSEIRRLVFNPSWYVPKTIATEDLLPKVRANPAFLAENGFRIVSTGEGDAGDIDPASVDWSQVDAGALPYRFVQRPGDTNSLGLVKIAFDNPYDIYLHDTPAKGLFALRTRTFSSGCVRLEQAETLADHLLANYREPGDTTMRQWLESSRTRAVDLTQTLPIYVVYITSWVEEDGTVNFRRDLYRRDAAVAAALQL